MLIKHDTNTNFRNYKSYSNKIKMEAKSSFKSRDDASTILNGFQDNFRIFNQISSVSFFICNLKTGRIKNISKSTANITGYLPQRFLEDGISFFLSLVHHQDYQQILFEYLNFLKVAKYNLDSNQGESSRSFNMRIRHEKGHWIWIEITFMILKYSKHGLIEEAFGLLRDVSSLKSNEIQSRKENDHSSHNYAIDAQSMQDLGFNFKGIENISQREKQVLHLIAHGLTSQMIADQLHISRHTVITHRQNLIHKFDANNTAELVLRASRMYWL